MCYPQIYTPKLNFPFTSPSNPLIRNYRFLYIILIFCLKINYINVQKLRKWSDFNYFELFLGMRRFLGPMAPLLLAPPKGWVALLAPL